MVGRRHIYNESELLLLNNGRLIMPQSAIVYLHINDKAKAKLQYRA